MGGKIKRHCLFARMNRPGGNVTGITSLAAEGAETPGCTSLFQAFGLGEETHMLTSLASTKI